MMVRMVRMVRMVMTMIMIMTSSQMCLEFWMVRSLTSMHDQSLNSHHCYHDHHLDSYDQDHGQSTVPRPISK